jgi:hypothetical protein
VDAFEPACPQVLVNRFANEVLGNLFFGHDIHAQSAPI